MSQNLNLNTRFFKVIVLICFLLGAAIVALSFAIGKIDFFLLLNADLGMFADYFFKFITYGGDGILWLGWLVYLLKSGVKKYLPLFISTIVLLTIFTQVSKQVILPYEPRPSLAISNQHLVHYVHGVTVHSINSFPSGHTATAFVFVLLISLLSPRKWVVGLAIFVAILVGYSRIYLGQHFPLDVGGGMLVACCTMILSVKIQCWFEAFNKKTKL